MYAVFEDGSRQYKVSEGEVVRVDYRDVEVGSRVEFGRVLLFNGNGDLQIGRPALEGARILGEVVDHPSTKTYIQKFRKRKNYRRLRGHRQPFTAVRVRSILLKGMEPPPEQKPAPAPEGQTSQQRAEGQTAPTPPAP